MIVWHGKPQIGVSFAKRQSTTTGVCCIGHKFSAGPRYVERYDGDLWWTARSLVCYSIEVATQRRITVEVKLEAIKFRSLY
jgi:hypothetical protein